jgi:hypothetical protein
MFVDIYVDDAWRSGIYVDFIAENIVRCMFIFRFLLLKITKIITSYMCRV